MAFIAKFLLLVLTLFVPRGVVAADTLSLDGAMSEGLRQSPQIQGAQAVTEEKRWRKADAWAGFLPKISLSGVHFFAKQYTLTGINFTGTPTNFPGFYPSDQIAVDVTVPLFNGLASLRHLQAAALLQNASEKDLVRAEFQLAQDIRLAFYKALAASELQKVSDQNVKTLEDHLHQIRIQRQGGVATKYDTLRVEVQLSEARSEAIDAADSAMVTRLKLNQLLGIEKDDRPLVGYLPVPDPERVKNYEVADLSYRADIQAMNLRAEAADKEHSARGAWLIPTISLNGQYLLYNSQIFATVVTDTGIFNSAYNVGLRLNWNIFDGGSSMAQAKAAWYETVQADKNARTAQLQVPYDLAYWKKRYVANSIHYLAKKLDIERSEESVRLAKEEEKAGTRTTSETLDAILDLFRAKAGVVNAQVNAIEALLRLELALGRKT